MKTGSTLHAGRPYPFLFATVGFSAGWGAQAYPQVPITEQRKLLKLHEAQRMAKLNDKISLEDAKKD